MARKTLTFALIALLAIAAHAQHFDWVKTYTGPDLNGSETNNIVGSFVDAEGNFYFLGEFSPSATLCGIRLLPQEVVSEQYSSVVVAKLSPSGQLMWHKAIYGPQSSYAYSLCPMGDTAFMVMVGFMMSHNFNSFLYYLDTLLTSSAAGYLQSCDSTASPLTNGFITFRLDGSVAEQHFIELGYIDSTGRPLTIGLYGQPTPAPDALESTVLSSETFTIDNDGNIYIARLTKDYKFIHNERFAIDDGTIATFKITVDGIRSHLYPIEQPSAFWNQQILKFSPHFDSLITATPILDSTWNYDPNPTYTSIKCMSFDQNGNLYVNMSGSFIPSSPMYIINSDNLYLTYNTQLNCLLKYTPELSVTALANFNRGTEDPITFGINKMVIDSTQNKIFVSGQAYWGPRNINITYNGDTLEINNGSAYWMCLDLNDLRLISYGQANRFDPSESRINSTSTATAYNNRVFMNIKYQHSVSFADTILATNGMPDGFALAIWDYEGHEIEIIDFNSFAYYSHGNQTHIKDSIVYFDGTIYSNADFGTIHIPSSGGSQAFIARYVDTAFLTPYTPIDTTHTDPIDTGSVRITVVGDEGAFVAYPNPFRQKVTIEVQGGEPLAETAWLTDLTGRRQQVRLIPQGHSSNNTFTQSHNQIYTLDLTSRPQATYLLTLTTASGKTHTIRLLKQSDIFGQ